MEKRRIEALNFAERRIDYRERLNIEEERKRTQDRQNQRQVKNEIKEQAEICKLAHFQVASLGKSFPDLQEISEDQKQEILRRSRRSGNAPVPPRIHLKHTKRFIEWFRVNVLKDETALKNQIEKNKDTCSEKFITDFSTYYEPEHDFGVTIIQRVGQITHGYSNNPSALSNFNNSNTSSVQPNVINSKRVDAAPPSKPLVPSDPNKKFGIGAKVSKTEETKVAEKEESNPEDMKSTAGIKNVGLKRKPMGGISGLGGNKKSKAA